MLNRSLRKLAILQLWIPFACGQYNVSTYAGGAMPSTPASAAVVSVGFAAYPAVDGAGNLYFIGLNSVFKVDINGTLTHIAAR
jgi:hypothetical protein